MILLCLSWGPVTLSFFPLLNTFQMFPAFNNHFVSNPFLKKLYFVMILDLQNCCKNSRELLHNSSPRLSPMLTSHITWYNYKNLTINKITLNFYTKLFKPLYSCHQFFHHWFSQSRPICDSSSFVPSVSRLWYFLKSVSRTHCRMPLKFNVLS